MIPKQEKKTYETFSNKSTTTTGADNKKAFAIKQSREAFRILSSGVYSDKVLAVVRELSSNALDAHMEAGTQEKPFDVHLPNSFEPWFSIRDYGTGLSNDKILNLYTTYFESTKAGSNNVTGMMGIGSKSPFAYTDQFTVTSFYNGSKSVFSCFIAEDGLPKVKPSKLDQPTHSPDGLSIHIGVNSNDFGKFKSSAEQVYLPYEVFPNITGNSLTRGGSNPFNKATKLSFSDASGDQIKVFCGFRLPSSFYRSPDCFIKQGSVVYPLDIIKVVQEAAEVKDLSFDRKNLLRSLNSLLIEVPLGSVNVTASRESLEYDEMTIKYLIELLDEVLNTMTNEAVRRAVSVVNKYGGNNFILRQKVFKRLLGNIIRSYSSNSSLVMEKIRVQVSDPECLEGIWNFHGLVSLRMKYPLREWDIHGFSMTNSHMRVSKNFSPILMDSQSSLIYTGDGEVTIILNPVGDKTKGVKHYRKWARYNFFEKIDWGTSSDVIYLLNLPTEKECNEFEAKLKKVFGQSLKVCRLKDFEEPPKKSQKSITKQRSSLFQRMNNIGTLISFSPNYSKDPTEGGVYVPLHNGRPDVECCGGSGALKGLVAMCVSNGVFSLKETEVVGIPATIKNVPKTNKGWVHIKDFLRQKIIEFLKQKTSIRTEKDLLKAVTQGAIYYRTRSIYERLWSYNQSALKKLLNDTDNDFLLRHPDLKKFNDGMQTSTLPSKNPLSVLGSPAKDFVFTLKETALFGPLEIEDAPEIKEAEATLERLRETFPLLCARYFPSSDLKHYVSLVVENYLLTKDTN